MMIRCLLPVILIFQVCLATPLDLESKITNSEDVTPGEFPYLVSIQQHFLPDKFYHICSGTILNKNYVLTARHCTRKYGTFKVLAGKHYITQVEATQQEAEVEQFIVPHNINIRDTVSNDIAILKLKTPLIFNKVVSPVELPEQNEVRVGNAVICGWGSISKTSYPQYPEILQKATLPVLDNESCFKKLLHIRQLRNLKLCVTQICTNSDRKRSVCTGDSGSPLVQKENGTVIQIGIVSWGIYPCGNELYPSVYTRVASYVDWINNIINA